MVAGGLYGPARGLCSGMAAAQQALGVIGKIRPQIFLAIICATAFSCFALYIGMQMQATEIVTAVVGGIFGFLGGVSLKVLENE